MDFYDDEFGQRGFPKFDFHELVVEKKLDKALRRTEVLAFQDVYENGLITNDTEVNFLVSNLKEHYQTLYSADVYAFLLKVIDDIDYHYLETRTLARRITPIIDRLIKYQMAYMHNNNHHHSRKDVLTHLDQFLKTPKDNMPLIKTLHFGTHFSNLIPRISKSNDNFYLVKDDKLKLDYLQKNNTIYIKELNISFYWTRKLLVIQFHDHEIQYVAPIDVSLEISNKLLDLSSIYLYVSYAERSVLAKGSYNLTVRFIKELRTLCIKHKDKFFTIAKSLEAFANAEILLAEEDWENIEFLLQVSEDLLTDVKFDYKKSKLRTLFLEADTIMKYELGCLSKIMGHPYVLMQEGSQSIFKKNNEVYNIDHDVVNDTICFMKENFIKNYYARHKRWPPVQMEYGTSKYLTYAWMHNLDPRSPLIPIHYKATHSIKSYNFVELLPCEKFKYLEQFIPYLKDRTISLMRQTVKNKFIDLDSEDEYVDWRHSRLLLHYLLSPINELNHVAYIKKFNASFNLEELKDYLVIRIVPKEKEMKEKYRGFGCKTYEDRARCLAQEKTAMEFLEQYSEDQAMAIDEINLSKKLRAFRTMCKTFPQHRTLCINIDASSWNAHMRSETVDVALKQTLDKIYDTSIFGKTQLAFSKSLYYVPDGKTVYWWDVHEGSIEGLNQDSWVVVYMSQIKAAIQSINYKYYILCRGDDLRIFFIIPNKEFENETMVEIKNRVLQVLSRNMAKVGHEIKIQDSYGSEKLFTFCKQAAIGDLELTQAFRKIQKCHGSNNAFLETLDEYIASSFSNAHSAAKVTTSPVPCYYVACFWALYALMNSQYYKDCTEDQLIALLLTPSLAGGFPIIYLHNFYIRAESDLLTPYVDIAKFIDQLAPNITAVMQKFMITTLRIPHTYEALYNDPYSLPILRPTLPTGYLRAQMPESLERITKNQTILELLREVKSKSQKNAIKALDSCNILHAKPLSVIYAALPKALLESILKMFESSKSVLQLLCNRNRKRMEWLISKAYKCECSLQKWRMDVINNKYVRKSRSYSHLLESQCPLKIADDIREFCWGKPVVGVSMPPMNHLMIYYKSSEAPYNKHINENHFTYFIHKTTEPLKGCKSGHFKSGGQVPFVGYKTRPGTQIPVMQFVEKDQFLTQIKNMAELNSWFYGMTVDKDGNLITSNISKLINKIVKLYTDEPLTNLYPVIGMRRSGVVEHHLQCQGFLSSIIPNMVVNRYTRISGTTNTHVNLVDSADKYKLNILHIYCHSVSVLTSMLDVSHDMTDQCEEVYGVTTDCLDCRKPIVEHPIIFNEGAIDLIRFKSLKALKVSQTSIDIFKRTMEQYAEKEYHDLTQTENLSVEAAAMGVLLEEFNTYQSNVIAVQHDLEGHLPSVQGIDLLKTLSISNVSKNTSITELKAIPVAVLAKALSYLITDYMLKQHKLVYSLDQINALMKQPGHYYPWFRILQSLAHTGRIMEVFTYLRNKTKIDNPILVTHISEQAKQLVVFAMYYSLYIDSELPKFLIIKDLLPETNTLSLRSTIMRCLNYILINECTRDLDPQRSFRRSLKPEILEFLEKEQLKECSELTRTRLVLFIRGVFIITSKYISPNIRYTMKPISIAEHVTLDYLYDTYGENVEELPDLEEYEFNEDFDLMEISETIAQRRGDLRDLQRLDDDDDLRSLYDKLNKYSANRIHLLLKRFVITEIQFLLFLSYWCDIENEENDIHGFINYISESKNYITNRFKELSLEVVIAPIASCGQKLRAYAKERIQSIKPNVRPIDQLLINPVYSIKKRNTDRSIQLQHVPEGNQPWNNANFNTRTMLNPKVIVQQPYRYRIYGLLTVSMQALIEIFDLFQIDRKLQKIVAFGTGLGGDVLFFNQYFDNPDIFVLTLRSGNYSKELLLPYITASQKEANIYDEHIRSGVESILEKRNMLYAEESFGKDVQLVWNDVEGMENEQDYHTLMNNLMAYYENNRAYGSILISKIDINYTEINLKFISMFLHNNHLVFFIRPTCLINCSYFYIIVISSQQPKIKLNYNVNLFDVFIGQSLYNQINDKIIRVHEHINFMETSSYQQYDIIVKQGFYHQPYLDFFPLYWRTMLAKHLDILLANTGVNKILRVWRVTPFITMDDQTRKIRAVQNLNIRFHQTLQDIKLALDAVMGDALYIDNQQQRITMVQKSCSNAGFYDVLEYYKESRTLGLLSNDMIHAGFVQFMRNSHPDFRDTHLAIKDYDQLLLFTYNINDVPLGYIQSYIKGVCIAMSFLNWIEYCEYSYSKNNPIPYLIS